MTSPKQVKILVETLDIHNIPYRFEDTDKTSIRKLFYEINGVERFTTIKKGKMTVPRLFEHQVNNIVRWLSDEQRQHDENPTPDTHEESTVLKEKGNGKIPRKNKKSRKMLHIRGDVIEDGKTLKNAFNEWLGRVKKQYPQGRVNLRQDNTGKLEIVLEMWK